MGDQTQAYDIFQAPLSSGYPLPLMIFLLLFFLNNTSISHERRHLLVNVGVKALHSDTPVLHKLSKLSGRGGGVMSVHAPSNE